MRKYIYALVFTAELFTIARTWKQAKCPSTDQWIKKMWYIYTIKYYSVTKKNENLSFVKEWMDLKGIILSEISDKYHMISLMYRIKNTKQLKQQKQTQRQGTKNGC